MFTVSDCIDKLNNNQKVVKDLKNSGLISCFQTLRNYEKIFYKENTEYTKIYTEKTINELKNKIVKKNIKINDKTNLDVWDINPYNCKKYVIICAGISSNKSCYSLQKLYLEIVRNCWGVIAFDYRGRGKSSGDFSQRGMRHDIESIYNYLRDKDISPNNMGIIGHSLGSYAAIELSRKEKIGFTIVVNPFSSATDMAKCIAHKIKLPSLIKNFIENIPDFIFPLKNKFNNIKSIKKIKTPLLIIHNEKDETIPVILARRLYLASDSQNITYKELDGYDHEINEEKTQNIINYIRFTEDV